MTRMSLLIGLTMLLFAGTADAQVWQNGQWVPTGYHHASTAAEGYLSGAGRFLAGRGIYLQGLGEYLNDYEAARRSYIDNWSHYVHTRWAIKDEWSARQKAAHPDWPTRRMQQLDMLERAAAVRARESELRERGILPPKSDSPGVVVKGKLFESYEDFQGSPEWRQVRLEAQLRELDRLEEEQQAEIRREKAVEFGRMWAGMSWLQRERYTKLDPAQRAQYKLEWKYPDLKYERMEQDRNRRFYEARPYLIPQARQPGSQLPPVPPGME